MYEGTCNVLGLMSGTSLDGMDAALVQFSMKDGLNWRLLETYAFDYPAPLKRLVISTFTQPELLSQTNTAFADWTKQCIDKVKSKTSHSIDLVSTHGQTIFHEPQNKFTLQAGCLPSIAKETAIPLVTDFRVQDVLLGGQGAPLVPMGDHLLFGEYEAALNLGGFANASLGDPILSKGVVHAFDICPVNYVLNSLAREEGLEFDEGGTLAAAGSVNEWVLDELNSLEFYEENPPKSLGAEWVEEHVFHKIDYLNSKDALATFCEHVAIQIGQVLRGKTVLVTGGGAWNTHLMKRIRAWGVQTVLPNNEIIAFKEAIIFALLGYLRFTGQNNVLGHTTGSGKNHSSGKVFWP